MMLKLLPLQLTDDIKWAAALFNFVQYSRCLLNSRIWADWNFFPFFFLPCMNYWSGVDKNTDTRESIFNQEASLFLLMRENMSLLLRCLNLSWVSSQFHQMTIGNTYFIMSPLNYWWDFGVLCPALLFLSLLLCFKNKKESIFSKALHQKPERNLPASPRELVMVIFWPFVEELKTLWTSQMFGLRKKTLFIQIGSCNFGISFWGKSVPNGAHRWRNDQEITVRLMEERKFCLHFF